eukprot:11681683-Alexandrium_andersonii.AAC.1
MHGERRHGQSGRQSPTCGQAVAAKNRRAPYDSEAPFVAACFGRRLHRLREARSGRVHNVFLGLRVP